MLETAVAGTLYTGAIGVVGFGSYVVFQVLTAPANPVQYLGPVHNTIYGTDNNPVPNSVTIQQGFTFKEGEYRDNDGNIRAVTTGEIVRDKSGNGSLNAPVATPNCEILSQLGREAKDLLRTEARDIWFSLSGRRAIWDDLQVHHRIPLEWSHIFPRQHPNQISNLVGVNPNSHSQITKVWNAWRQALDGKIPTQAEIMEQALKVDEAFESQWVYPQKIKQ